MATFTDLSEYSYSPSDTLMLNVGWLGLEFQFTTGPTDSDVVEALLLLADQQDHVMRGVHDCEFCDEESPIRLPAPVDRGWVSLGMGEIRVAGESGVAYAAPSLIIHYIIAHRYRPPDEFIEAVRATHRLPRVSDTADD